MSDLADNGAFRDGERRRRTSSKDEKRQIVAESCARGVQGGAVAGGASAPNHNLLFTWRRQLGGSSTEAPR